MAAKDDKATPTSAPAGKKTSDKPLLKVEDVPKEIRDYVLSKTAPADKSPAPAITAAKENGSYYGKVISNSDKYLVQLVGKEKLWLIAHPKDKIELQNPKLQKMDAEKQLNNANIQIHYTGDKAKAYPWDANKDKEKAPAPKALKQETLLEQAKQYAQENIKNAAQRTAFVKHMENVADKAFAPKEATRTQPEKTPAPAKAKTKSKDQER